MKKFTKKGLSLILVAILSLSFNLAFAHNEKQGVKESQLVSNVNVKEKKQLIEEKRQKVVNYMLAMANVPWRAGRNMEYWNPRYGIVFKCGEAYFGIPYSQTLRNTSLETFKSLIENGKYAGLNVFGHIIVEGSDCSSALLRAWRQLNPDTPLFLDTSNMIPTSDNPYDIVKVGEYKVPEKATTSTEIIKENTKETLFLAYSKLQPADAVVRRSDRGGHVILVKKVDLVNHRIIGIEQTGVDEKGCLKGKDGHSSWNDNRVLTFDDLYDNAYIPITTRYLVDK